MYQMGSPRIIGSHTHSHRCGPLVSGAALIVLLLQASTVPALAVEPGPNRTPGPVMPSANLGRPGKYHVDCMKAGYGYWVCVPVSYSEDHPAGLHIFFHGQHGQGGAPEFGQWESTFLKPYNLIGINMQYMDGDNMADTSGKVDAAQEAIAQTIADYKIIVGRGVVSSFSGGGLPHSLLASKESKVRGPLWPFCHSALYSSNYRVDASQGTPMSWYIGVGTEEWTLADLGPDATRRTEELYQAQKKGASPDVHFKIIPGKGHQITAADVQESASAFPRSDLAYAPFLYAPDFAEPDLRTPVALANGLVLGPAQAALAKLNAKKGLADAVKAKVALITAAIDERLSAISALATQLASDDPTLSAYYLPLFQAECKGTPIEKSLHALLVTLSKDKAATRSLLAHDEFIAVFPALLTGGGASPTLMPDKVAPLMELVKALAPTSQTGRMAAEMLLLRK
jgi:hypothetical protein